MANENQFSPEQPQPEVDKVKKFAEVLSRTVTAIGFPVATVMLTGSIGAAALSELGGLAAGQVLAEKSGEAIDFVRSMSGQMRESSAQRTQDKASKEPATPLADVLKNAVGKGLEHWKQDRAKQELQRQEANLLKSMEKNPLAAEKLLREIDAQLDAARTGNRKLASEQSRRNKA